MPAINLPNINISGGDFKSKETMEQILDTLQKYRKELNFLLMNLDTDNMPSVGGLIGDLQGDFSLISQTIEGITLAVANIEGDVSTLQITAEGIRTSVSNLEGNISTLTQTVDGFQTTVSNQAGQISTLTQTVNGLQSTVASLDTEVGDFYSEISQLSNEISSIVSFTDVTGNQIASKINQTATTISLSASKIDLNGITRVNSDLFLGNPSNPSGWVYLRFGNGPLVSSYYGGSSSDLYINASKVDFEGSNIDFTGCAITGLNATATLKFA